MAFIAFIWPANAYGRADQIILWFSGSLEAWLVLIIMFIASIFIIGELITDNPTIVVQALVKKKIDPSAGIVCVTCHLTMWAFSLWALSHFLVGGDVASPRYDGILRMALVWGSHCRRMI